jgi:hypothetical protein
MPMALSAFVDRENPPSEQDLETTLLELYPVWRRLREETNKRIGPLTEEWGFTSPKTGWGFRLKDGKRAILYMTPCQGYFLASFALGEKAVPAAKEANLPTWIIDAIEEAPRYAEGRGVRLKVTSAEATEAVLKLAEIKKTH